MAQPAHPVHPFDTRAFARHGLVTAAFCCLIAAGLSVSKQTRWDVQLAYSLGIGMTSWLVIELGRQWLTRHSPIPWPLGWRGFVLTAAGVCIGFVAGTALGDLYSGGNQGGRPRMFEPGGSMPALVITIFATIGISGFFYSRGKSRHLEALVALAQRDAAEARLKLLETQLEPHMLFNTLANLRVLIGTDPARAQEMLDRMIAYLRATLSASRSTQHPLENEFDRLRDYLELMAVRMGPRLAYTLDLPDALRSVPVPPLLLQPLVENAIRHGLEPQVEGGHITVRASTRPGDSGPQLVLEVIDTGVGLPEQLPPPGPGQSFGLAQARERLATLHGNAGTLELIAENTGGTRANVIFPLKFPPTP